MSGDKKEPGPLVSIARSELDPSPAANHVTAGPTLMPDDEVYVVVQRVRTETVVVGMKGFASRSAADLVDIVADDPPSFDGPGTTVRTEILVTPVLHR